MWRHYETNPCWIGLRMWQPERKLPMRAGAHTRACAAIQYGEFLRAFHEPSCSQRHGGGDRSGLRDESRSGHFQARAPARGDALCLLLWRLPDQVQGRSQAVSGENHCKSRICPSGRAGHALYLPDASGGVAATGRATCPKCGMALVPVGGVGEADDTELRDLKRRLWIGVALSFPLCPRDGADDRIP